jgi:hypothetical protein
MIARNLKLHKRQSENRAMIGLYGFNVCKNNANDIIEFDSVLGIHCFGT